MPNMLYIDVTDLYWYAHSHSNPTGIQRVCTELLLTDCFREAHASGNIKTILHLEGEGFLECDYVFLIENLPRILDFSKWHRESGIKKTLLSLTPKPLRGYLFDFEKRKKNFRRDLLNSEQPIRFGPDDLLFVIGAGWVLADPHVSAVCDNVRLAFINYDLIPLQFPEYFSARDRNTIYYRFWAHEIASQASLIFSISRYADQAYREVFPERIDHQVLEIIRLGSRHRGFHAARRQEQADPFVLNVSTIEIRKNHLNLLKAWIRLVEEVPDAPRLVIVGRRGWLSDPFFELFEQVNGLDGKVVIREGVTDKELAQLYADAEFTVFPSYAEGWGLPVEESLSHGTPCIASNTTSIPEVGGDLVDYVDPGDPDALYGTIARLVTDGKLLQERRERIASAHVDRSWEEPCRQILTTCRRVMNGPDKRPS